MLDRLSAFSEAELAELTPEQIVPLAELGAMLVFASAQPTKEAGASELIARLDELTQRLMRKRQ